MLAVGTADGRVCLIDPATGNVRWEVQGRVRAHHAHDGVRVAVAPDGRFVASVSFAEECWKLWDTASGAEWMTGARHDGSGACTCTMEVGGGRESLNAGCPVLAHTDGLFAVDFSPCGQRLATGGEDHTVMMWDARTGQVEHRLQAGAAVVSLSFSADGGRLASASGDGEDGFVCVWDVSAGELLRRTTYGRMMTADCVQFSPRVNSILASASADGYCLWDIDSSATIKRLDGAGVAGGVRGAVFSPDGGTMATVDANFEQAISLTDVQSGLLLATLVRDDAFEEMVLLLAFSEDGSKLASCSSNGACKVWDSSTGALLRIQLGDREAGVRSTAWGRDWVRDTQRGVAFAMGHHPRLGAGSQVLGLEAGVVRMILDRA